jgi:hypothetical protein
VKLCSSFGRSQEMEKCSAIFLASIFSHEHFLWQRPSDRTAYWAAKHLYYCLSFHEIDQLQVCTGVTFGSFSAPSGSRNILQSPEFDALRSSLEEKDTIWRAACFRALKEVMRVLLPYYLLSRKILDSPMTCPM